MYNSSEPINAEPADDAESHINLWLFDLDWSDDEIISKLYAGGYEPMGRECHTHDGDCCGRWFARKVWINRRGPIAIVQQFYGLDV